DPAAVALLDLLGGPALDGATQRVAHGGAGDDGHGAVFQPAHVSAPRIVLRWRRARGPPPLGQVARRPGVLVLSPQALISSQPAWSSSARPAESISPARNRWKAGVA